MVRLRRGLFDGAPTSGTGDSSRHQGDDLHPKMF